MPNGTLPAKSFKAKVQGDGTIEIPEEGVNKMNGLLEINPSIWHPEELIVCPEGHVSIPMKRIRPPNGAVRESYGPIHALKGSIKRRGLLQPLAVRPLDPEWREFEPVIGCRRYAACTELKHDRVSCNIKPSLNEDDIAAIALEENIHRKNLTLKETTKAIQIMLKHNHSEADIANVTGMGLEYTRAYIKMLSMPQQIKYAFHGKEIHIGHLVVLSKMDDATAVKFLKRIKSERLTITAARQIAQLGGVVLSQSYEKIPKKVKNLLGKNLFLGEGNRGVFLKICAKDKSELRRILYRVTRYMDALFEVAWHGKLGRKKKPRRRRGDET